MDPGEDVRNLSSAVGAMLHARHEQNGLTAGPFFSEISKSEEGSQLLEWCKVERWMD